MHASTTVVLPNQANFTGSSSATEPTPGKAAYPDRDTPSPVEKTRSSSAVPPPVQPSNQTPMSNKPESPSDSEKEINQDKNDNTSQPQTAPESTGDAVSEDSTKKPEPEAKEEEINSSETPALESDESKSKSSAESENNSPKNVASPPLVATEADKESDNENSVIAISSPESIGGSDNKIGATVPGDGHVCANCKATQTPLWRRGPNGQVLCNACGLYIKARNIHRPLTLKRSPNTKKVSLKNAVGSCLGDGRCNGTGGSQSCSQCPSFLNNSRRNKTENTSQDDVKMISCQNCGTVNTPLWRRDVQGHVICNACGLYNRMHKDGRPAGLQTAIVKRRKRNRSQSETGNDAGSSFTDATDSSQPPSAQNTPQMSSLVPLQPRSISRRVGNSPGAHFTPQQAPVMNQVPSYQHDPHHPHHHTHNHSGEESKIENVPRLCCSHLNPGRVSVTPEYQPPPGYGIAPGPVPPPQQSYGYLPVPGMPFPGMPPGGHFALGHMPPIAQLPPYNPYDQQPLAALPPQQMPHQLPQHIAHHVAPQTNQTTPQPIAQPAVQPAPVQSSTQPATQPSAQPTPQPIVQPAPAQTIATREGSVAIKSPSQTATQDSRGHEMTSLPKPVKRSFKDFDDDQGDSPLSVLQYLTGASQDTKKEYLLAAQRQLLDKVSQYRHRLEAAEYQLGMCENALRSINQES